MENENVPEVDGRAKQIVRTATVSVDRSLSPEQVFDATGCKQCVDDGVRDAMPRGKGEVVTLRYFKPRPEAYDENGWLSPAALDAEYEWHGLVADPAAQAADNAANPKMANSTPNACQWKDASGMHCCVAFCRWLGERRVNVDRYGFDWSDDWSFPGVCKEPSAS